MPPDSSPLYVGPEPPRWLIVVRRDKPDVYASLHYSFELDAGVHVILDRRRIERRGPASGATRRPARFDRRQRQRRAPPPPAEAAFARHAGFFLVEQGG